MEEQQVVSPENSRKIRNLLMAGYGLESKEAVRKFIQNIVGCVAKALAEYSDFNGSEDGLLTAFKALVFGLKQSAGETFARRTSPNKSLTANERVAKKLLQLVLAQNIPDEESFVYGINTAVAEKEGIDGFDIYSFLQQHMDKDPAEFAGLSLEKMSNDSNTEADDRLELPKSLRPGSQIAITFEALAVLAAERNVEPGDELGIQSDLRSEVADLTGLEKLQVTGAAGKLADKGFLARKSEGQSYRLFWRPDLVDEVDIQAEEPETVEAGETESTPDPADDESDQQTDSSEEKQQDSQLYLSKEDKVDRLLHAFREIRRKNDYVRTKQVNEETFAYIGRQDKIMPEVENLGGFSQYQRTTAVKLARERGFIYEDGSPLSGKARYYLREDLLTEDPAEDEQSDQEVTNQSPAEEGEQKGSTAEGKAESDPAETDDSIGELLASIHAFLSRDLPAPNSENKERLLKGVEESERLEEQLSERLSTLKRLLEKLKDSRAELLDRQELWEQFLEDSQQ